MTCHNLHNDWLTPGLCSDCGYSAFCERCGEYTASGKVCRCPPDPRAVQCDNCGDWIERADAVEVSEEKHSGIYGIVLYCERCGS